MRGLPNTETLRSVKKPQRIDNPKGIWRHMFKVILELMMYGVIYQKLIYSWHWKHILFSALYSQKSRMMYIARFFTRY